MSKEKIIKELNLPVIHKYKGFSISNTINILVVHEDKTD